MKYAVLDMANFNPRSPHGERHMASISTPDDITFQPTLPARGATTIFTRQIRIICHFNPRSPHGERRRTWEEWTRLQAISTHAPRTGSDSSSASLLPARTSFQPTLPARGATAAEIIECFKLPISTHAPRTGSDCEAQEQNNQIGGFQPTLPARGATCWRCFAACDWAFQPTLPARGATMSGTSMTYFMRTFQPTLPARGATE